MARLCMNDFGDWTLKLVVPLNTLDVLFFCVLVRCCVPIHNAHCKAIGMHCTVAVFSQGTYAKAAHYSEISIFQPPKGPIESGWIGEVPGFQRYMQNAHTKIHELFSLL